MIHRALLGSIERFFAILLEHYAGAFPVWLSPVQVVGIPVADAVRRLPRRRHRPAQGRGVRAEVDHSDDRMQKKIRNAHQGEGARSSSSRAKRIARPARSASASATAPRTTACRSTTPSQRIRVVDRRTTRRSHGMARLSIDDYDGRREDDRGRPRCASTTPATSPACPTSSSGSGPRTGWSTSRTASSRGERRVPVLRRADAERRGGLIVARGEHAYVLLNLFPYNSGHLLVCPYRHVALYDEATPEEVAEIGQLTQTAMRVIRRSRTPTASTSA